MGVQNWGTNKREAKQTPALRVGHLLSREIKERYITLIFNHKCVNGIKM